MKHYKTYIIGVLSIILYKLCVFYLIFVVFVSGIATAFIFPQECYNIFIDKDYSCLIIKKINKLWITKKNMNMVLNVFKKY